MSNLLTDLYSRYNIQGISSPGVLADALGDLYEDFVALIFCNLQTLQSWQVGSVEYFISRSLLEYLQLNIGDIYAISASKIGIPQTPNGGTPKTDVYLNIVLVNGQQRLVPLNIKQSTVAKVAFAEYDVDTIVESLGITDSMLIQLLRKHQNDASAKNFTPIEREYLRTHLAPYARALVRWCITLNPNQTNQNISYPEYIIKFDLHHPKQNFSSAHQYKCVTVYDVEGYIDKIMLNAKGEQRTGGFGTGLSWTYATGSKGTKMQFKG